MKKITSLFVASVLLLFSCKKEQTPATGSISGSINTYESATPLLLTPVKNIKLYLINAGFKFDTVTSTGNRAAIVDSTVSDARGTYRFSNLAFGKYYVSPLPDTAGYRFEPVAPGNVNPLQLSEATPDHSLSFSSPMPGGVNGSAFTIELGCTKMDTIGATEMIVSRQYFFLFCPYFEVVDSYYVNTISISKPYGMTIGVWTETNNFLIGFYDQQKNLLESYWITQDLGNTPELSKWAINLTTHTIVRTYP